MALLLCEGQQNWLRVVTVVFRTISYYFYVFIMFLRFFFQNPFKKLWLFTFFPCFVRFLELWISRHTKLWRLTCFQMRRCWTTDLTGTRCRSAVETVPAQSHRRADPSLLTVAVEEARRAAVAAAGSRRPTADHETAPADTLRAARTLAAASRVVAVETSDPRASDNVPRPICHRMCPRRAP